MVVRSSVAESRGEALYDVEKALVQQSVSLNVVLFCKPERNKVNEGADGPCAFS